MTTHELEQRITAFIQDELLASATSVGLGDNLLSGELLDSMSLMRLAAFVADEFDFQIRPTDFVIENFENIAALAAYVQRATGRTR